VLAVATAFTVRANVRHLNGKLVIASLARVSLVRLVLARFPALASAGISRSIVPELNKREDAFLRLIVHTEYQAHKLDSLRHQLEYTVSAHTVANTIFSPYSTIGRDAARSRPSPLVLWLGPNMPKRLRRRPIPVPVPGVFRGWCIPFCSTAGVLPS
jgi:hypothetical protein